MITFDLLKDLQTTEWEELKRFTQFRFPRIRQDVYRTLDVLRNHSASENPITREQLHHWLFKNRPYNDKVIRYLLTDTNKVVFEYFSFKQLAKKPEVQQTLLLQELSDRKCFRAFEKTYNQELKRLETAAHIYPSALNYSYELHALKAKTELESGQRSSAVFEQSSLYLDHYFVAKKLQISAERINLNFILNKEWNDPFLSTILQQIDGGFFSNSAYIGLYRLIIKTLTEPENEAVFSQLKQDVPQLADRLSEDERSDLYQYLLNYCIRRVNAGRLTFQNELLSVYQSALKNGALLSNGRISQWDFKNVVTVALRVGEFDYAREFIYNYKQSLAPDQRKNALAYNLANLHFYQANHRAAIKQLQLVDLDDVFYRLDARSILLKSYYELDDTDALFYHATAFRSMLNRNRKISDNQRKLYLNLIKHTLSLSRAAGEKQKVNAVKERVKNNPNVADLSWLEGKLAD